ncbi:MAG: PspC domain-containing protein [Nocardioides sp.]
MTANSDEPTATDGLPDRSTDPTGEPAGLGSDLPPPGPTEDASPDPAVPPLSDTPDGPAPSGQATTEPSPPGPTPTGPAPSRPATAGPATGERAGPRVTREEALDLGRLRRNVADAKAGGVASGLARHFDIDPVIVRVLFVVTGLFGVGVLAYLALWLLVPADNAVSTPIGLDDSSRAIVIIVVAVLSVVALFGAFDVSVGGFVFLGALAIGTLVVLRSLEQRRDRHRQSASAWTHPAGDQHRHAAPSPPVAPPHYPPHYPPGYPLDYRPAPRPVNPRKRGPLLFGFTIALLLFALGLLGVAEVGGADVPGSAYPALAVSIIGLMLVVGAWYGRAGGLIALGLVGSMTLAGWAVGENFDGQILSRPRSATEAETIYQLGIGELVVDLTRLDDPEQLAGQTITVDAQFGQVVIVVPSGVDTRVNSRINHAGNIIVLGQDRGSGTDARVTWLNDTPSDKLLTINAELGVGEIEVRTS